MLCENMQRIRSVGILVVVFYHLSAVLVTGDEAGRRLFDDLLSSYNKLVRPIDNHSLTLQVQLSLKLSQLLDVHEKDQLMKTNVWLRQEWYDSKLHWQPSDYNGIEKIAGGNYEISIMTKATVRYDGFVVWEPPAVYHSMCEMNIKWFPFDIQTCYMKFGTWSNDGFLVDLVHYDNQTKVREFVNEQGQQVWRVENAVDLTEYHPHVEWDILVGAGERHWTVYPCCETPFVDITYYLTLRRKTLFYTVNLIIPCVGISFLTIFVFYLPADSGEKIVMCISILISLNVFFLLQVDLIPSTSTVMPLIAHYLLFTMILVTLSVAVTVMTLSIHHRSPTTARMPDWLQQWFFVRLPPLLLMRRPTWVLEITDSSSEDDDNHVEASMRDHEKQEKRRQEATSNKSKWSRNASRKVGVSGFTNQSIDDLNIANFQESTYTNFQTEPRNSTKVILEESSNESEEETERRRRTRGRRRSSSFKPANIETYPMHDVWERRRSMYKLLKTKQESRKALMHTGSQLHAIRYVASCVALIAHKIRREAQEKQIIESWCFVGMVIDRFFLFVFSIVCVAGTCDIILRAPTLYDRREAIP